MDHYTISFDYAIMPQVMKLLKEMNFEKIAAPFGEKAEVEFLLPMNSTKILLEKLEEWEVKYIHHGRR
jgi:hypothetical protein